jgi:hypothetical protein
MILHSFISEPYESGSIETQALCTILEKDAQKNFLMVHLSVFKWISHVAFEVYQRC